ncbi:MAG TPA: DUF1365 domain-containing protein [Vicinamibacterales bacterium]|nr:DUF1365 domain-containing protein [Vicinamibacterales bacterium]
MTFPEPGLYVGRLRHRRLRPRAHEVTYPVFLALLDVDRIPELMRASRLTAYNGWGWASFDERDHFGDAALPLRQRVEAEAAAGGVRLPDGPIYLLTNLRYLGYCFNPVSFFYCYDIAGRLQAVLAEVNNTFGETHNYWLTAEQATATPRPDAHGNPAVLRYATPKVFHVSRFNPMEMGYRWALTPPGERLAVHIDTHERGETVLDATLVLERRPWNAREIRKVLARHPWMTAKVLAAIHYQALRLYLKGLPFYPNPTRRSGIPLPQVHRIPDLLEQAETERWGA